MPIPHISRLASRVAGKLPLQTVLIVPFVVQIVGTVGLVGFLSYKNGYQEVSNLATQLQLEINSRIAQHLDSYLAVPSQLNQINVDAYELKLLNLLDFKSTGQYFWRQLKVFHISYINFATPKGEFIGAVDYGDGSIQIEEIPKSIQGKSYKYDTDQKGNRTRLISVQNFDPHEESWYFNAVRAGKPVWSEIYNWDTNPEIMSIAASYPLYDENKTLIGVTGIDLKLSDISRFLNKIKIGKSGKAFILERTGLLVASSVNEPSFTMVNGKAQRLNASMSHTPAIQQTTEYLQKRFGNLNRIENSYQLNLELSGQPQYVQVSPWRDHLGLNWLVVVVIPKADFTEQINANNRTTILLCIAALLGSIGVGILTARWITKPILRLNTAAKDIAKGEWDEPVEIERSDEVGELAVSFKTMAAHLQQSFAELKFLNEALGQSERKLRGIFNQTFQFIGMLSPDGLLLEINQTALDLGGLQLEDVINQPFWKCSWWTNSPETQAQLRAAIAQASEGEFIRYEVDILGADHYIFKIDFSLKPIFDESGKAEFIILEGLDITARKQAEKILAEYNRTLETQVAARTTELGRVNEQLMQEIAERKQTEQALQSSQARFAGILEIANDAIITINASQRITLFNQGAERIFGYTADEILGQPIYVLLPVRVRAVHYQHITTFTQSFAKARRMGDRSEIFGRRKDGTEFPADASISKLEINGETFFTAILRDISERKQFEQALIQSEERFQEIARTINQCFFVRSASSGQFLYVSPAYEKIWGRTCESLYQNPQAWIEALHPHDRELVLNSLKEQFEGNSVSREYRIIQPNGSIRWIVANISVIRDEAGQPLRFIGIAEDISDRKAAEIALKQSETRFLEISESSPANIYILVRRVDGSFDFEHMSRAIETMHEIPIGQILENANILLDCIHPEDRVGYEAAVQGSLEHLQPFQHEWRVITPSGKIKWLQGNSRPKQRDNGEIAWYGIVMDISDRKLAEAALKGKTEELDRFFGAALDLLCIANTEGYFLRLNPQWEKTLGYRLEDLEGTRFLDYVHPEDLDTTLDAITQLADQQEIPNFVNRYRCRDGLYRWIEWRSVPVGNLIYASARDISDRTQAEEALRQSEATNRAILSTIPDLLIWMNQDGTYLEIAIGKEFRLFNPGQSYVGNNIYNVLPHPIARQRMEYVQRALQTGELQVYEHQLVVKQEIRYEETRIAASENGQVLVMVRDITARKRTEETLREREEQLQLALEGSGDGFWDWKIQTGEVYFSPRYLEMLGYEADELPPDLSNWDRLIHPDDKHWVMQTLNAHLADSSVPYHFDYRVLTKSGEWKWIANYGKVVARDQNGTPLRMTGTHRDVSDRKRAELELQEREYRLRTLADNLPNGVIYQLVQEPNGKVYFSYITAGIERLVGIKPEVAMQDASVLHNLVIEEDRLLNEQLTEESRRNLSMFEMQMRKRTATGKIQWSYVRSAPRRLEDGRTVWDGIEIDITNLKQAEAELAKAKEAAEAANRAKSAFLANMSHELRTPLNGILGYAQILQRDKNVTPKQKEGVDIIYQCGMHLLMLINDILDISKIEAGKLELYPEDFNFSSFLIGVTEIFRLKAEQKSLTFTYLPLNELPTIIHADEKRLRQVLMNLLSNAVKFTDIGSVIFKVELVHGNEPLTMNKIRFQVEDTGIGISPEQLAKIFLPFEQVGDSSRYAEGTGLGLAITQKIVELMGSKIFVESSPNVGSRFGFDLDVPVVSAPMKPTPVKRTDTIIAYSGSKRKILIVDDRWENRAIFINILESIGFELEEAADGQEGLEKALEFQPDLILADLVMPVMDGYQMIQKLRQLPQFKHTIIIAISANAFVVDQQKSLQLGCNDFLPKPIQREDLLDKIQSYLNLSWISDHEDEIRFPKLGDDSRDYSQMMLTEMIIPPKEELLALYEAANNGYVNGVEEEVIRLQQLNPDYYPFVTRIMELAKDFEYEKIVNLIDSCFSEQSE